MNFDAIAQRAAWLCQEAGYTWKHIGPGLRDAYLDRAERQLKEEERAALHARVYEPPPEDGWERKT